LRKSREQKGESGEEVRPVAADHNVKRSLT
jgi:hypothetical protein